MLSKSCPIQRPAFGFLLQKQEALPKGLRTLNGPQVATQLEIKQVVANHHELRQTLDHIQLYCIYCGKSANFEEWQFTLHSTENNGKTP